MKLLKPVIITSIQDICGQNIRSMLIEQFNFEESDVAFDEIPIFIYKNVRLVQSNRDVTYSNHLDNLEADLLLFGSRHKSEANKASLLTHATGNLDSEASHGGNPFELSFVSTRAIRESYLSLLQQNTRNNLIGFDVTVETTHHGPTSMNTPLLFIEVGSTDEEYNNMKAIDAVCNTIMNICLNEKEEEIIPAICFGGGHYATRFNELMELSTIAIGHILPKYKKDYLTTTLVEQMIDKTIEKVKWAIIDRNSLNASHVQIIEDGCSTRGVEVVKARDVKYEKQQFRA